MTLVPLGSLLFPIQYIEVCDNLIRAQGGDLALFHQQCGFDTAQLLDPLVMINGEQLLRAYTLVQQYCSVDRPASLQVLQHFPLTAHGMLGMLALASRTLGDALHAALEFFPLMMPAFKVRRVNDQDRVRVLFERVCDFGTQNNFFTELVMLVLHKIAPFTLLPVGRVMVGFQHQLIHLPQSYIQELGEHILVTDNLMENSLSLARSSLDIALITQSPTMYQLLQNNLRQRMHGMYQLKPVSLQVRRLTQLLLDENRSINAEVVAGHLHMSSRTLTRRLAEEGSNLAQLHREVAVEYASWLLQHSPKSIGQIAMKAGFASEASFSRAFRQLTGKTPRQFRES